jgi:UDP-N-acetylglucosamine 2-epimerase
MVVATIVGARPQFIKAAPVSRALKSAGQREILIHTGQHYDHNMSRLFFEELELAEPDVNLGVGSGSHGQQTGLMLARVEEVLLARRPDAVLVYGDTNSTLAGALAACKLRIKLAHVEAGLRSRNREMPEEHNRVLTDHCSDLLFCPTRVAVENLAGEGLTRGVHLVGDTMYDALRQSAELAARRSAVLNDLKLEPRGYLLATLHRPYNTDTPEHLRSILEALVELDEPVVFPVHPRTRKQIAALDGPRALKDGKSKVRLMEPVGYLDMLMLERHARLILTDSGGLQKEALFCGVPCVTLRPETEWVETVAAGWNVLTGADRDKIVAAVKEQRWPPGPPPMLYGDGHAAEHIVRILMDGATG